MCFADSAGGNRARSDFCARWRARAVFPLPKQRRDVGDQLPPVVSGERINGPVCLAERDKRRKSNLPALFERLKELVSPLEADAFLGKASMFWAATRR